MRFVEIDGKQYAWRDILQKRREQLTQSRQPQATLFELRDDAPPPRTAMCGFYCFTTALPFYGAGRRRWLIMEQQGLFAQARMGNFRGYA